MPEQVITFDGETHRFPADFTDADIAAALSSSGPTRSDPLASHMGARPIGGYETSDYAPAPSDPGVKGLSDVLGSQGFLRGMMRMAEPLAHPSSLGDMGNLLLPSGVPSVGRAFGKIEPALESGATSAVNLATDVAKTARQGLRARDIPGIGPIIGRLQSAWGDVKLGRAMSEIDAPSNVATARRSVLDASKASNTAMSSGDVADVLAQLRKPDTVESVGGSAAKLVGRKGATVMEPEVRGGFKTSQPDKWGVQTLQRAKPLLSASDVVKIRVLMQQGVSEAEAVRAVAR